MLAFWVLGFLMDFLQRKTPFYRSTTDKYDFYSLMQHYESNGHLLYVYKWCCMFDACSGFVLKTSVLDAGYYTHQPHGIEQFRSKLVNIRSTQLIKHKRIIHFWWVVLIGFHDVHKWVFEGRSVKNRMWSFFLGLVVVCPFMMGKRAL